MVFSFKESPMRMPVLSRFAVRCWLAANLLTVLLAARPKEAPAGDVYWNLLGPADWNNLANWSPIGVPTGTDNATFNNDGTANYSTNVTDTFYDIRFGDSANSGGTVNQSNGTINGQWLRMNMSGNANATYNLSGGSATFTRINVNETAGSGVSTLSIQGGTLTVPQSGAGGGQGALFIGGGLQPVSPIGNANVNVSSGTLSVGGDTAGNQSIVVGSGGNTVAALNVSGTGTVTVVGSGNVEVGSSTFGVVDQTGGTVNLFTAPGASSWLHVGDGANGTYTLSGGTLTLTNPNNNLVLGNVGSGEFDLNGGTATLGPIYGFGSSSVFNFNGGTLRPNANQASMNQTAFMSNLTTANVRNGGAIIDTNGFNVTISQPLVHSTISGDNAIDGGLTKLGSAPW
jgi:hypothetical protein